MLALGCIELISPTGPDIYFTGPYSIQNEYQVIRLSYPGLCSLALYRVARNQMNTVFDTKRLIGRKFSDQSVQIDIKLWPFWVESLKAQGEEVLLNLQYEIKLNVPMILSSTQQQVQLPTSDDDVSSKYFAN